LQSSLQIMVSPFKSSGTDGFAPSFYLKFWLLIGEGVCQDVLFCLN
jgi:hypothetical protein